MLFQWIKSICDRIQWPKLHEYIRKSVWKIKVKQFTSMLSTSMLSTSKQFQLTSNNCATISNAIDGKVLTRPENHRIWNIDPKLWMVKVFVFFFFVVVVCIWCVVLNYIHWSEWNEVRFCKANRHSDFSGFACNDVLNSSMIMMWWCKRLTN